ncbi:hypothetical protein [Aquimarina hainanensis]|uniref:hypothetical protein n=1 Tax=Aquimarina hainanensis TaxID=1578017 RepID=UPI00361FBA0B
MNFSLGFLRDHTAVFIKKQEIQVIIVPVINSCIPCMDAIFNELKIELLPN